MKWEYYEHTDEYVLYDHKGNQLVVIGKYLDWLPKNWQVCLESELFFLFRTKIDFDSSNEAKTFVTAIVRTWMRKNLEE